MRRRTSHFALGLSLLCLLAALTACGRGGQSLLGSSVASPGATSDSVTRPSGGVLPGGEEVTFSEATSDVSFVIQTPRTSFANPEVLVDVWVEKERNMVALQYHVPQGDMNLLESSPPPYSDPEASYTKFIAENDADATITSVRGQIALAITGHTASGGDNPSWLEYVDGGVMFILSSFEFSVDQLTSAADSLSG